MFIILNYCYDCGNLIIAEWNDSIWYCEKCSKKRGWNIIDGKRVKIEKEKPIDSCCENEERDINGGCINCGDPCIWHKDWHYNNSCYHIKYEK